MSKEKIVAKFGGTSMKDAQAMTRSATIAKENNAWIITVSATSGTTNKLIALSSLAEAGDSKACDHELSEIRERHISIAKELGASELILKRQNELLEELEALVQGMTLMRECSPRAFDKLQSFGERLSSNLFTQAVNNVHKNEITDLIDARDVLKTDSNYSKAAVDFELTKANAKLLFNSSERIYVTQGFIGSNNERKTTTLGRGGSDYSAAIFAEAANADILQIWTDVAGIKTTDPRICPNAKRIEEITFKEAAELAVFGAKVLHPTTLTPAMRSGIKVFVGNSFDPSEGGTWISRQSDETPLIRAMAKREDQCLLTISTPKMLYAHGFLFEIFKIFNQHKISVDSITTSEISVALTVHKTDITDSLKKDLEDIADVKIEEDLTLVSMIGNNINYTSGIASKIFNCLEGINVRMICQGASKHNFCFLVGKDHGNEAISKLHQRFIES